MLRNWYAIGSVSGRLEPILGQRHGLGVSSFRREDLDQQLTRLDVPRVHVQHPLEERLRPIQISISMRVDCVLERIRLRPTDRQHVGNTAGSQEEQQPEGNDQPPASATSISGHG